jgi:hypothetical protein
MGDELWAIPFGSGSRELNRLRRFRPAGFDPYRGEQMMWPFKRKPASPRDMRFWNDDWKVGDTAECIVDGLSVTWHDTIPPWERPSLGQQFIVVGLSDEITTVDNSRRYFLHFKDWPVGLPTTGFRKVRTVTAEESEVVSRILKAKPGKDRVRKISA